MPFLEKLHWRFATNAFDPEKKVSDQDLQKILEAIQFSPSSFGLQPYHIDVMTNVDLKKELQSHAWNQPQVADAPHYLVFSARSDLVERIDQHMRSLSGGDPELREKMKSHEQMMMGFAEGRDEQWIHNWSARQAYIALGFGLAACAEMNIDACPMEGFDPAAFDKVLHHPHHLRSVVSMAIGYRKEEPRHPKVRFPKEDLFTHHG